MMSACAHAVTTPSAPQTTAPAPAPAVAAKAATYEEVLNGCAKLTHSEWLKKYSDAEDKVMDALEKNPKLSEESNKELFEVVFPQILPKTHPMKNAFVGCFKIFTEYQKAINNVESMSALKQLESCYQDAYKIDPPKVLGQYLGCLKSIKY